MSEEYYSERPKIGKIVIMVLTILALTAIVIVSILRDRIVNVPMWSVSVIGQGKVTYQADIANITLGVQVDKVPLAEETLNQLNDKVAKIVVAVKAAGIADTDIQTQNYSLYPQYDYKDNVSTLAGYSANQQLVIKVGNIIQNKDLVSKVIAEAAKAGANQVLGIGFDVSNLNDLKQEARIKALDDAQAKAGSLANAAGVKLGKVTGWWENIIQAPGINTVSYSTEKGGMGGGSAASPTVPNGNQEIIIELNLNYQVK